MTPVFQQRQISELHCVGSYKVVSLGTHWCSTTPAMAHKSETVMEMSLMDMTSLCYPLTI